jgi:hypothetical protein
VRSRLNSMIAVAAAIGAISLASPLAGGQGAQRSRGNKPDLSGPAPRLPNGKPSMSGVWGQVRRADVTDSKLPGYVKELPYTAWGQKQWDSYDASKGDYTGSCLPFGISRTIYGPHPIQIIQDNDNLVFLAEQNTWFHIVPTDGRKFDEDLPPSWFGESIGHWDGDTLVIETHNLNGYVRVDTIGHPLSNQARITQTFKRVDYGHALHTYTVDDPKTYTKPWTITETWTLKPDVRIMEYSCEEGNHDLYSGHIKGWRPPEDEDSPRKD